MATNRTAPTTFAATLAAMTNTEFLDFAHDMFDGWEGPTCPHCDAAFPHSMANNWCWCAGCDACTRTREAAARFDADAAAVNAEAELRWPTPPAPAPVFAMVAAEADCEAF